jgi:hypothetical protein
MNLKVIVVVLMFCFLIGSVQTAIRDTVNRASVVPHTNKPGIVAIAVSNFINSARNFEGELACP